MECAGAPGRVAGPHKPSFSESVANGGVGAATDGAGCLHLVWEEAEVDMGEVLSREMHYERLGACPD